MRRITKEETINVFNEILKGLKLPQKKLEFKTELNAVIAKNCFGKIINVWYVGEDTHPLAMIRDICDSLLEERR